MGFNNHNNKRRNSLKIKITGITTIGYYHLGGFGLYRLISCAFWPMAWPTVLHWTGNISTTATCTELPVAVRRKLKVWPFRRCSPFGDHYLPFPKFLSFFTKEVLTMPAPSYKAMECNGVALSCYCLNFACAVACQQVCIKIHSVLRIQFESIR